MRPRVVWITTALILGVMALGLTGLKANGLTNAQSFRGHPDSVVGQSVLDQHFPAGAGQPVQVVRQPGVGRAAAPRRSRSVPGITGVTSPVTVAGHCLPRGHADLGPGQPGRVRHHRPGPGPRCTPCPAADALVGGNTAINLDVQRASAHDRNLIIPIVLVVVFVILALLLRALVAPLMLIATVVLSFAATLGVSALFFDHVFNFGGADTSFPLFVFVFLVALGIDYNIFLMTRVREEAKHHGTRTGALTGLAATGGVITVGRRSCWPGRSRCSARCRVTFLTELGFAVAFGVLLDTIVVRSVLVTALNLDLGRWMWWPSRLARQPAPEEELPSGQPATVPLRRRHGHPVAVPTRGRPVTVS